MKRIFAGLALALLAITMLTSCASSRGVGCPGNPTNYRYR